MTLCGQQLSKVRRRTWHLLQPQSKLLPQRWPGFGIELHSRSRPSKSISRAVWEERCGPDEGAVDQLCDLSELWFDGGCSVPGIADQVADMLEELQPHAIYFQGCGTNNTIHWIGTESETPNVLQIGYFGVPLSVPHATV